MRKRRAVASALGLLFAGAILFAGVVGERRACDPREDPDDFNREAALALAWSPPSQDDPPEVWMPARVASFRLRDRDVDPAVPNVDHTLEGPAARYGWHGRAVEVRVAPADADGYRAFRRRMVASLDQRGVFARAGMASDEFKRFAYGENDERGLAWWTQGWLLFFWTDDGVELEGFARAYRDAVEEAADAS